MKPLHKTLHHLMLLSALVVTASCSEAPKKAIHAPHVHSSMETRRLLQPDGTVDKNLLELLKLYNLDNDGTPAAVNKAMQEHFLRKPGQERRDLTDGESDSKVNEQAMALIQTMGFVDAIEKEDKESKKKIDHFLIFGAMIERIETRFKDCVAQHEAGEQMGNIVFLGGVRPLRQHETTAVEGALDKEGLEAFLKKVGKTDKAALTEADLCRFVWEQYATAKMKTAFEEGKNLFFVNSTTTTEGTNDRPITKNTLEAWLNDCKPTPGRCHSNVEQPYATRLAHTLQLYLEQHSKAPEQEGKTFTITWNSAEAVPGLPLRVFLDEIARAFYTEYAAMAGKA